MPRRLLYPSTRCLSVCLGGLVASAVIALAVGFAVGSRAALITVRAVRSRPLRTPLYGLTVDDVGNVAQLVDMLRRLPQRPTMRIYFDTHEPAQYYAPAVNSMKPVSYLMGELLDSSDESRIGTDAYSRRVRTYLSTLGRKIDVWEIGNEVNGNWLGPYRDVEAKLLAAYDQVSAARKRTALTLYYNLGCGDGASELDPLSFSRRFVPRRVRNGLNFVLLSYYEQNCQGIRPSAATWTNYFSRTAQALPPCESWIRRESASPILRVTRPCSTPRG